MPQKMICRSFFPAGADRDAGILILGSMPGAESLRRQEYYAFCRNGFWRIMGNICGFDAALPYRERVAALAACHIALWDVLQSCERPGSPDAAISHPRVNPVGKWLKNHPECRCVFCNGGASARYFRKYFPQYAPLMTQLPSTSPAAANLSEADKLKKWEAAFLRAGSPV